MRALIWHVDEFSYWPVGRESDAAEEISEGPREFRDSIVAMVSAEVGDGPAEVEEMASEIADVAHQVRCSSVVVYPYAHLSSRLAPPQAARDSLEALEKALASRGLNVHRAPFGWTKGFQVRVKGHPLAEQLKVVEPGTGKARRRGGEPKEKFHRFIVVDDDGSEHEVTPVDWRSSPPLTKDDARHRMLAEFVRNELEGRPGEGTAPRHVYYMRKLELVDYAPESDVGHMKWYPNGVLVRDLILDYAYHRVAREWGAMKMQNPLVYRTDVESIRMLQGEFHERDYSIEGGLVLRFASDPGAFPFVQKLNFTYRQMPLKVYEEANCFRKEQKGELTGLMRVRSFLMTDHHAFIADEEQAKAEYRRLSLLFKQLMDDVISGGHWVLGFEFVEEYYEKYRDYIRSLVAEMKVPAFIKLMKEMSHYYAFKSEYQAIFPDGNNVQISTVQWDVKNGERFHIKYVAEDGKERPVPIILHASSFGSIERTLASLLERAAWDEKSGLNPMLPFWLSPEQVRIIPVRVVDHMPRAVELADELERRGFRVGLDDRDLTLSKRVRDAKSSWIPYVVVIGDDEVKGGYYSVTPREGFPIGKEPTIRMRADELVAELERKQGGMPTRPLYIPREVSLRPIFTGVA
ncbi:MAG TPA: threonine--tRNA ligase [Nitrososphaeria archaeon]|jgi:threonyl-tRNA synthetase|nr:threonine--tRNA ligase [Nitrososphaeria archaeon]